MESEWRKAIFRFVLNNMGQLEQEEFDAWLDDDLDLAPLLAPVFRSMPQHRDRVLAELHQISPAEVLDRFMEEHPELDMPDKNRVIVKIGKELEAMKGIVRAL